MMKKLLLVLTFLVLTGCSVGNKCTYTQDGTKISSWVWFFGSEGKPIDVDKNNCN